MDWCVRPAAGPLVGTRRVPASKSMLQRALVLRALSDVPPRIELLGDPAGTDVRHLEAAVEKIGPWAGGALGRRRDRLTLHLGLGATGFRFALALATLRPVGARTLVTGDTRLLARPHVALRRALGRLGAHVKRRRSGSLRVVAGGVRGAAIKVPAHVSSQYASALLLIAPRIGGLALSFAGRPVSRPYLDLTLDLLRACGVGVDAVGLDAAGGTLRVSSDPPSADRLVVEPDASSAAVWWAAAALTRGDLRVEGLPRETRQADARLLPVLARMGAEVVSQGPEVRIRGGDLVAPGDVDLRDSPDLLPLVGALAAAAPGTTRILGVGHARFKESDRVATTRAACQALGVPVEETPEGLVVHGGRVRPGVVDAAGDHRLVLAFGVLGLVVPGVVIRGAEAVSKSWPGFCEALDGPGGARIRAEGPA